MEQPIHDLPSVIESDQGQMTGEASSNHRAFYRRDCRISDNVQRTDHQFGFAIVRIRFILQDVEVFVARGEHELVFVVSDASRKNKFGRNESCIVNSGPVLVLGAKSDREARRAIEPSQTDWPPAEKIRHVDEADVTFAFETTVLGAQNPSKVDPMDDQPIYMLNALWFNPDGGTERYKEYLKAAGPIVARYGGKKLDSYLPEQAMIGEFDADLFFVVEWPSWEVFQAFINDSEFEAIRHLREEAITKSLLIRCCRAG